MPIELHLVSDLQNTALPPVRRHASGSGDDVDSHQIGKAEPNFAVENVVAPRVSTIRSKCAWATIAELRARLNSRSVENRFAGVEREGAANQSQSTSRRSRRAQVEFLALDAPYGFSRGEMRVDGGDTLPADDRFLISVERTDPGKILFVDDGRHPRGQLYFRAALDSSADAAFQLEAVRPELAAGDRSWRITRSWC